MRTWQINEPVGISQQSDPFRPRAAPMRVQAGLIALGILLLTFGAGTSCSQPLYTARARNLSVSAANEILRRQSSDGAITLGTNGADGTQVEPYFANLAAIGLADAFALTHDNRYSSAVRRWIAWYEAHMSATGVVDDYGGRSGARVSLHTHDSVDSYAGTYLYAVLREYDVTRDKGWLAAQFPYVKRALLAIASVTTRYGLTIAKPSYAIMYTMDNVETMNGLRSAAKIAAVLGHKLVARDAAVRAQKMQRGLRKYLWLSAEHAYAVAMAPNGVVTRGLSSWYPDIMANLMAIAWQRQSKKRIQLFDRLYAAHLAMCTSPVTGESRFEQVLWWAMAAKRCGQMTTYQQLLSKLESNAGMLNKLSNTALLGHVCRLTS